MPQWTGYDSTQPVTVGQVPCVTNNDCYGAEKCEQGLSGGGKGVCVCSMWSPRENHAVSVQHVYQREGGLDDTNFPEGDLIHTEDYIYVVGGFVNLRKR